MTTALGKSILLDDIKFFESQFFILFIFYFFNKTRLLSNISSGAQSRAKTESLAKFLQEKGLSAQAYHAGLDTQKRKDIFSDFIHEKTDIIRNLISVDCHSLVWQQH
jgi:hypothetical protein